MLSRQSTISDRRQHDGQRSSLEASPRFNSPRASPDHRGFIADYVAHYIALRRYVRGDFGIVAKLPEIARQDLQQRSAFASGGAIKFAIAMACLYAFAKGLRAQDRAVYAIAERWVVAGKNQIDHEAGGGELNIGVIDFPCRADRHAKSMEITNQFCFKVDGQGAVSKLRTCNGGNGKCCDNRRNLAGGRHFLSALRHFMDLI
jgi:hypothetical protein